MAMTIRDSISDVLLDYTAGTSTGGDVFVDGDYAYVVTGANNTLVILDVSDSDNISIVGSLDSADLGRAYAIYVEGDYAYIASDYMIGIYLRLVIAVVDISDKANPTFVRRSSSSGITGLAPGKIFKQGNFLIVGHPAGYMVGFDISIEGYPSYSWSSEDVGSLLGATIDEDGYAYGIDTTYSLKTFDLRGYNSTFFEKSVQYENVSSKIVFYGFYMYVVGDRYLKVYSISTGAEVGSIDDNASLDDATHIEISGSYAFVFANRELHSISLSDPTSPSIVDSVSVNSSYADVSEFVIYGNYAYIGCSGINIIDISDPTNMSKTDGTGSGVIFTRGATNGSYYYGITSSINYIYAYDVSDKNNISYESNLSIASGTNLSFLASSSYLVLIGSSNIYVYDVSDPSSMSLDSTTAVGYTVYSAYKEGNYVYATTNDDNFLRIDVSNLSSITITKIFRINYGKISLNSTYFAILGGSSSDGRITLLKRTSLPATTTGDVVGTYTSSTYIHGTSGLRFLMPNNNGYIYHPLAQRLSALDNSTPSSISLAGSLLDTTDFSNLTDVYANDDNDYVLVSDSGNNSLHVINASNKASMTIVDTLTEATNLASVYKMYITNQKAYCLMDLRFTVVDVSDYTPAPPTPSTTFVPKVMVI
jgi:hypothetical protein